MKNKLLIINTNFFSKIIDIDKKMRVIGIKSATSPIDWNKKSATILPLIPKRFSIIWLDG